MADFANIDCLVVVFCCLPVGIPSPRVSFSQGGKEIREETAWRQTSGQQQQPGMGWRYQLQAFLFWAILAESFIVSSAKHFLDEIRTAVSQLSEAFKVSALAFVLIVQAKPFAQFLTPLKEDGCAMVHS